MYTLTTAANVYKRLWPNGIEHLVVAESPLLALITKWTKFKGSGKELAWRVSNGGQVSADITVSQARSGQSVIRKPYITREHLYITKSIDHEALEASEGQEGALIELVEEATTNAIDELKRTAGQAIIGDHYNGSATGAIGRISAASNVASDTITLYDITQIRNFYEGQTLQAFQTAGGALRSAGAVVTVESVDEQAGTITVTGASWAAGIAAVAASDFLVGEGNYQNVPAGLFAWNPATLIAAGAGDSFFTVDRGGSIAMQGCRYAPAAGSVDEVLIQAMHLHRNYGGNHDTYILNPIDLGNLIQQANTLQRIQVPAVGSNGQKIANLSFEAVVLNGPKGPVKCFADEYMPRRKAKLLNLKTCELWSLNDPFRLLTRGAAADGMLRESDADASEMRWGGYWNFVCKRPRDLMDVTIPA